MSVRVRKRGGEGIFVYVNADVCGCRCKDVCIHPRLLIGERHGVRGNSSRRHIKS